ncbi:MAG TPA: hypothetical protein VHA82_20095 [Ramlibacter sp.]|uniref:hypothetical protein n=1 Tax=Ramlibacter sp. TaxID=1917967 RepID=UPI002C8F41CF|nr:hypothetical protein [Ramlibacter sp.]HVZ46119.1 hypothetical protein [Ramlibacter sp.]
MASTDLRGFADPLAAVRRQREWELDAALVRAAALRARVAECESQEEEAAQEVRSQSARAAEAWRNRGDPSLHARFLAFLVQAQARLDAARMEKIRIARELATAREDVTCRQRRLEVLVRQRDEALAAFRIEQNSRQAAQADDQWSMVRLRKAAA